ncbi:MAG: type VI secretion system baseplate subunit TssK [Planctomycetes bacterium]|nr:type VI secretion system baseplate subunit TssK [Planctomycetota bacterium]
MTTSGHVHWHEGLFLQPHHLQALQRNLVQAAGAERRLAWAYPYGLIEAKLSSDELENMRVRFERLRLVLPNGIEVNVPETTDLPPLDIKQAFETGTGSFRISIGVPLWYARRGNAIELGSGDDWRAKRQYRVVETEVADENTGENAQPVLVRRFNARLLFDHDDQTDLEVLPLLRIAHATGDDVGLPRQDPDFIPPCMVLGGSPTLREMMRDLANQVEASRKELVLQLTRAGFSVEAMRGVQFEQMLRLKTLNRFSARLPHLAACATLAPFEMYLELRELLAELAALRPERDQFDVSDYNHDNPSIAFKELAKRIRDLLRGVVTATFLKAAFERDGSIMVCRLTDDQLTQPNEYFIGIRTKDDPRALAKLVEDARQFKLMTLSMVHKDVYGVRLTEERHPPLELPSEAGLHYFRLQRADSVRMWQAISTEKAIGLRWPGVETSDYRITLYMTVPDGG